jgi:hypothetical protein
MYNLYNSTERENEMQQTINLIPLSSKSFILNEYIPLHFSEADCQEIRNRVERMVAR